MLDLIVGIVILLFVFLGFREGIVKSLGSVAAVFVALFFATGALSFLSKGAPQFSDPGYLGTSIVFFLVWALSFVVLDLLLTLLFRKVIRIVILGPADKVGGALIGGFKGLLICGVVLQLALGWPIAQASKNRITESALSRFTIATYQWAYPYAKKAAPKIDQFMRENLIEKIGKKEKLGERTEELKKVGPEEIMGQINEYGKVKRDQEKKILKLLKEQKLLHDAPRKRVEDLK